MVTHALYTMALLPSLPAPHATRPLPAARCLIKSSSSTSLVTSLKGDPLFARTPPSSGASTGGGCNPSPWAAAFLLLEAHEGRRA